MTGEFPALYNDSEDFVSPNSLTTFRSDHPGGVQFVLLDGSVRYLGNESAPEIRVGACDPVRWTTRLPNERGDHLNRFGSRNLNWGKR